MNYKFKTKPMKFQVTALRKALKSGHIGLLCEPGTGKTKIIIDWASILYKRGDVKRMMVVAPLSVLGTWEDEFAIHAPIPYEIYILTTKDEKAYFKNRKGLRVLVVNYDLVWRRHEIVRRFDPQLVVADESHRIKKPSARRSRYLRRWSRAPYRAILTGTPTPKSYVDIYAQWAFLNQKQFGTRVDDFKARYVRWGGYMNKQVRGYTNVDELNSKIREDAIIRRKDQVLDLPPRTYPRISFELEPKAWEAYSKMAYELFLELTGTETVDAKNVAVKILRLQQITGGWVKSDEGNIHQVSEAKIINCRDAMEDLLEQDEKIVIFTRFKPELDAITDLGKRFGVPTYVLRGGVGREERDIMRRKFQARTEPSIFLAQIQAGGLGITLHSAHECLFYSVTYALDDYIQACDRLHRKGQIHAVTYRHLVARRTTDLDIYASLRAKKDIMATIMGSPTGRKKLASSLARNLGIDRENP